MCPSLHFRTFPPTWSHMGWLCSMGWAASRPPTNMEIWAPRSVFICWDQTAAGYRECQVQHSVSCTLSQPPLLSPAPKPSSSPPTPSPHPCRCYQCAGLVPP